MTQVSGSSGGHDTVGWLCNFIQGVACVFIIASDVDIDKLR